MKITKIYLLLLIGILAGSCNSLDLGAEDQYSINSYWKSAEQCERFVIGLHDRLRGQAGDFLLMGEIRGGLFNTSSSTSVGQGAYNIAAVSNSLSVTNPEITTWGGFYADLYQINHAIDKISTACSFLSNDVRNTYLGQLYGMRAYYYFHMLRTWGGVPLCDRPDILMTDELAKLDKPRASEQEIWNFVRDDIERSAAAYKELGFKDFKNKKCFWNKAATTCLKAEIYLWGAQVKPLKGSAVFSADAQADLGKAREALNEVESHYSCHPKFADAFSTVNKDANKETLLAIRYKINEEYNVFANYTYPAASFTGFLDATGEALGSDPLNVGGGALRYEWSADFYQSISDDDTRKAVTFYQFYKKNGEDILPAGRFLCKFMGELDGTNRRYTNDWPIYRYMDVALLLAEVNNALNEPVAVKKWIEVVRKRAYGTQKMPIFTYTNKEEAEEAILQERNIEFVGEGKRWYDVRRMLGGKYALELVGDQELKLVWPIDSGVLSSDSKVEQNEGYL